MKIDLWRSLLGTILPRSRSTLTRLGLTYVWRRLRRSYDAGRRPLRARVHGRWLWLNAGNPYPFTVREHQRYNRGLLATVEATARHLQRPISLLDVGAAVGDTVVLLEERCPGLVQRYLCIDGDEGFAEIFHLNTRDVSNVELVRTLLSGEEGNVRSLVRHHPGTAAAVGTSRVAATTLDGVLAGRRECWDLLKIDVDGFDGRVLAGARRLLGENQPVVYFEWHPLLYQAAGTDIAEPFTVLSAAGYSTFLWFGNRGSFSHSSAAPSDGTLCLTAQLLKQGLQGYDGHYDVLAVPDLQADLAKDVAFRTIL